MKNRIYFILVLICTLVLVQCRKDEIVTEADPIPVEADATNVSFLLYITDEAGTAVEEATITVARTSQSLTSDENGVVLFNLPSVAFEGERVTIEHPAYNTLTKMVTGVMNSHTRVDAVLTAAVTKLISTGETGSIGKGELTLPTSLLSTGGSSYTGPVAVKYTYLDPDDRDFLNAAPGNLLALNTANQYRQLASLGMYSIELYDEQGGELTIPGGSEATVKFPIAEANAGTVPDEVPLWYFDEEKGLWIEEGKAIVEGNMMVAQVSHFTWWNCDLPYEFVPLCMSFVDEDGNPVTGIEISFSVNGFKYGLETTDTDGNILTKTPIGEIITISYYLKGELLGMLEIGAFDARSQKPVIILTRIFSVITGKVVDCDMNNIASGYGILHSNDTDEPFIFTNGAFRFNIQKTGTSDLTFYDVIEGKTTTETISIVEQGQNISLGTFAICGSSFISGIRGTVMVDTDSDGVVDTPSANSTISIRGDADIDIVTDVQGFYEVLLPSGDYTISVPSVVGGDQTLLGADASLDGDMYDGFRGSQIRCTVDHNEVDEDNDFSILPPTNTEVAGNLLEDTDGNGSGDVALAGRYVTLVVPSEQKRIAIEIEADGTFSHKFTNAVFDGYLTFDLSEYDSVSDFDHSPDPDGDDSSEGANYLIPVELSFDEIDSDNNFIVSRNNFTGVRGTVMIDTDYDGVVDIPLANRAVVIQGDIIAETVTKSDGTYEVFLPPGDYAVGLPLLQGPEETRVGIDNIIDGDELDGQRGDKIQFTIDIGEVDEGNDFSILPPSTCEIYATVLLDNDGDGVGDEPLAGVLVRLNIPSEARQVGGATDEDGRIRFGLGNSVFDGYLTIVSTGYTFVSDYDQSPDPDGDDSADGPNNIIPVSMSLNESDEDNIFVVFEN